MITLVLQVICLVHFGVKLGTNGQPIKQNDIGGAFYYLLQYGYINSADQDKASLLSEDVINKAVKEFQVFAGIDPTGELNNETIELMNTPRCGVKDNVGPSDDAKRRKKRYALQGSRWTKDTLTWRISKYPSGSRLKKSQIKDQIKQAFDVWSEHTKLKFEQKDSGSVHIDIRFEKREHGDGDPFDGPGGTLAHAFFPQYGGDAHFDDEEYWTINDFRGTNLLQTAAHEFGHSLGLSHSDDRNALMAPFYRGWTPNLKLQRDDIDAIQALYGPPNKDIETDKDPDINKDENIPKPDSNPNSNNDELCTGAIDAIVGTDDGNFYVFKGSNYWKLNDDNENAIADGYPRKISDDWSGLPSNIDAAVTWPDNGMTYFFKGDEYWKFKNQEGISGYPKKISAGFDGIPNNVDAAFVWGGNGKIYFFKGDDYWKFDPSRKPPVKSVYPRNIGNWDLPPNINAAVQWSNKRTYFFKDDEYYRFNDRRFQIDSGDPPFPRPAGKWWFGCKPKETFALHDDDEGIIKINQDKVISMIFDFVDGDLDLDVIPPDE